MRKTYTFENEYWVFFAFAANPENDSQWQSGVLETEITSEGPIGVGTTHREVRQFLGRRIESTYELTEYEANRKWGLKTTSGPIPVEATVTFESVEGGTKATMVAEAEVGGFFRLAEPLVIGLGPGEPGRPREQRACFLESEISSKPRLSGIIQAISPPVQAIFRPE